MSSIIPLDVAIATKQIAERLSQKDISLMKPKDIANELRKAGGPMAFIDENDGLVYLAWHLMRSIRFMER